MKETARWMLVILGSAALVYDVGWYAGLSPHSSIANKQHRSSRARTAGGQATGPPRSVTNWRCPACLPTIEGVAVNFGRGTQYALY
jgi:hypothetical protein